MVLRLFCKVGLMCTKYWKMLGLRLSLHLAVTEYSKHIT